MHKIEIIYVDTHKYKHNATQICTHLHIKISNVVLRRRSRWRVFMDSNNIIPAIIPDIIPDIILLLYHNEGRKRRGCIFAPDN
jgi:ABC-type spermidine/putrescine transport system permease subunit II